ncbi:putative integral membrane protein [Theileria parva strain Muguga]|uniref:Uncharacterized protein n=1 Tax=Theileria parva TaxID=5875 RepID=Q4N8P4_THEPA|nr:putative integral membrane protein [Theileria parva strain Muguga]EAN33664.1 putative integral membrane protein [Theileria parva strain Muguga]|eukprot:XP_765947.1 hypothetical protein [Theileria parva strain Muguga]
MLVFYNANFSKIRVLNLIFIISLFVNYCNSFLYSKNGKISHLPLTHQFKSRNNLPKFKCSPDSTNYVDKRPYAYSENVIGLLSTPEKRIEIIRSLYDSISKGKSRFSSLLYVTNSHEDLVNVHNVISNDLNNDSGIFNGINIIFNESVKLYKNFTITLSDYSALSECLTNFGGIDLRKKALTLNCDLVRGRRINSFKSILKKVLESYFTNLDPFTNIFSDKNLRIHLDDDFLVPANEFIDSNFKTVEQFVDLFNLRNTGENLLEHTDKPRGKSEIQMNDEKLVIFNNFGVNYDMKNSKVNCSLYDDLILRLGPNCTFIGLSSSIYNVNNVANWLNALSKPTKVITLSKVPTFNLLTKYGHLNPFDTSTKNIANNAIIDPVNTNTNTDDSVDTNNSVGASQTGDGVENVVDPKKMYDMFKKKNNKTKLTSLNPSLDELVIRSIIEALETRGITTYNQLVTVVPSARRFFRQYLRILRRSPAYLDSKNRLYNLLKLIVNVRENKYFSKFIKNFHLYPLVNVLHDPSPPILFEYIKQRGLYPTVVYCFNDMERISRLFYGYLNSLAGEDIGGNPQNEVNSDGSSFEPFNDIILSSEKIEGAKHYIFLDKLEMQEWKLFTPSNEFLYTLTAGSDLVTFTVHFHTLFHTIKSLISPIYFNYSHFNNANNRSSSLTTPNTTRPVVTHKATETSNTHNTTHPVVTHNATDTGKISNVAYNGEFGSYLKECKEKYERMFPDYFALKELIDSSENRLKAMNVDTFKLMQINSRLTKSREFFETMSNSLLSKLSFRGYSVYILIKSLRNKISIIQGADNQQYSTVPKSSYLVNNFARNELMGFYPNGRGNVLLKNVKTGNYIITTFLFLKDVMSIREQTSEDSVNVYDILKDLANVKTRKIKVDNDLRKYINAENMVISVVSKDYVRIRKLSLLLPAFLKNLIDEHITSYNESFNSLMDLINNNRNTVNGVTSVNSTLSSDEMENNVNNDDEMENIINNDDEMENNVINDGVMKLVDEYLNLRKRYKRRNLEDVIKNYQFKNAFYGRS